jgi:hypothetical protein
MPAEERSQVLEMTGPIGRPAGDHRSADRIIEQSPVATRFLQSRDHYEVGDNLKRQVGDWTDANPDPEARANAAYDLDKVLRFIDNVDERSLNGSDSHNGRIDGFRDTGHSSLDNSEARLLSRFAQNGYEVLRRL